MTCMSVKAEAIRTCYGEHVLFLVKLGRGQNDGFSEDKISLKLVRHLIDIRLFDTNRCLDIINNDN